MHTHTHTYVYIYNEQLLEDEWWTDRLSGFLEFSNLPVSKGDVLPLLQYSRSTPGLLSMLIGQKSADHVETNMLLAEYDPLSLDEFISASSQFFGQKFEFELFP